MSDLPPALDSPPPDDPSPARRLGTWVQGLVMGVLLYVAIWALIVLQMGGRVFRYENF